MCPASLQKPAEPVLEVQHVSRAFAGIHAINDASFRVEAGAVTALIGPNGAGKSTMCSVISGFLRPDRGSVLYDGEEIVGCSPHRLAARGLLRTFQTSSEFPRLTVTENLLAGARADRGTTLIGALLGRRYWIAEERANLERARVLLMSFELLNVADQMAGMLSGGQKRLVELMRAIMARPRFLVLDEPLAGIHPATVESVIAAIQRLRSDGVTVLMIEHNLGVVERICDRVIVMANGSVIANGRMHELRQNPEVIDAYFGN
jgi:ABC-type branched-subunit amino acid transport system ATPase component